MWEIATLGISLTFTYFASYGACVYVCLFIYLGRGTTEWCVLAPLLCPSPSEPPACVESINLSHLSTRGWLRS